VHRAHHSSRVTRRPCVCVLVDEGRDLASGQGGTADASAVTGRGEEEAMSIDLSRWRDRLRHTSEHLSWLPLLLVRICLGGLFLSTGWGKVHNLGKVTGFFTALHIPAPAFNAALVGYSELICGALLLIGLASRLATIPLLTTMIVALLTAKWEDIHGITGLFGEVEFTYLCMLFVVLVIGPGAASIDGVIAKALDSSRHEREGEPSFEHAHAR
jgi:putative oxidoreductase